MAIVRKAGNPFYAALCVLTEPLDSDDHPSDDGGERWRVSWNEASGGYSVALPFASERDAERAALSMFEAGITPDDIEGIDSDRLFGIMVQDLQW